MNIGMLAGVVRTRAALRSHDRWSPEALAAQQARSLQAVRVYAAAHSPFYSEIHHGLADAPLSELPVVTKQQLMERFDDVVVDRAIRLADVEAYLDRAAATDVFRDRYRVTVTGGTTGRRGVFLADEVEWRTVLASYSRAYDWAGIRVGLTNRDASGLGLVGARGVKILVEVVPEIPRTRLGKAPLIRRAAQSQRERATA